MRILDCKNEACVKLSDNAPKAIDNLCDDCSAHFEDLKKYLKVMNIEYSINTKIVRGLDYYTRTVFEFIAEGIGAQSTVGGGGRYDGLIEEVGGPKLPGMGFAMGITRMILAMQQSGVVISDESKPTLYIASMGDGAKLKAVEITENLRKRGLYVENDVVGRSLKAQMRYADKMNSVYTLIIGDNELESGRAYVKDMEHGTQTEAALDDIDTLISLMN
jgi:histidyl-tRNA synthetase